MNARLAPLLLAAALLAGCTASAPVDPHAIATQAIARLAQSAGPNGDLRGVEMTFSVSAGTIVSATLAAHMERYGDGGFLLTMHVTDISGKRITSDTVDMVKGLAVTLACLPDRLVVQASGLSAIAPESGIQDIDAETANSAGTCDFKGNPDAVHSFLKDVTHLVGHAIGKDDLALPDNQAVLSQVDPNAKYVVLTVTTATLDGSAVHATYQIVITQAYRDLLTTAMTSSKPTPPGMAGMVDDLLSQVANVTLDAHIDGGRITHLSASTPLTFSLFTVKVGFDVTYVYGARDATSNLHGRDVVA